MSTSNTVLAALLVASATAFAPVNNVKQVPSLKMTSTVDPTVVTTKEYQDVCGVSFTDDELKQRLSATKFLYPRHVEVIEDIAPIADAMVDEIVSNACDILELTPYLCKNSCPCWYTPLTNLFHCIGIASRNWR